MRQHGVSHRANRSRRNVGKHYRFKRYRNQYSFKNTYQGPKVIYVKRELVRRGLRISVNGVNARSQSVTPHLSEYAPGLPRTIYFNDKACRSGMSCSIYLGANRSSPKIIVVGEKKPKRSQKPVIIYPPS